MLNLKTTTAAKTNNKQRQHLFFFGFETPKFSQLEMKSVLLIPLHLTV